MTPSPSTGIREPTGSLAEIDAPQAATMVAVPSPSSRSSPQSMFPNERLASSATFANTSAGGASLATRVATRRSAACSSASRCRPSRACAFETAVATSSVKAAMRVSASRGSGSTTRVAAISAPQRLPSTRIGAPTVERRCRPRAISAVPPSTST